MSTAGKQIHDWLLIMYQCRGLILGLPNMFLKLKIKVDISIYKFYLK